jgi:hypothetical protein
MPFRVIGRAGARIDLQVQLFVEDRRVNEPAVGIETV